MLNYNIKTKKTNLKKNLKSQKKNPMKNTKKQNKKHVLEIVMRVFVCMYYNDKALYFLSER